MRENSSSHVSESHLPPHDQKHDSIPIQRPRSLLSGALAANRMEKSVIFDIIKLILSLSNIFLSTSRDKHIIK